MASSSSTTGRRKFTKRQKRDRSSIRTRRRDFFSISSSKKSFSLPSIDSIDLEKMPDRLEPPAKELPPSRFCSFNVPVKPDSSNGCRFFNSCFSRLISFAWSLSSWIVVLRHSSSRS